MKLALAIIAKNSDELTSEIKSYYSQFDEVVIAVDQETDDANCIKYEWSQEELTSNRLDFARKRNFLHEECIKREINYYLTIDTDDIIDKPQLIRQVAEYASDNKVDLVYFKYNYSKDEFGNINAVHYKERIVKCSPNMYWNMPIHENMIPVPGYNHSILTSDDIVVTHNVDNEHSEKSFDRNIQYMIEEWNNKKEATDPRTLAYLGRCLMAKKQYEKAIFFLQLHIKKSGWDEDRCTSMCQLSDIYRIIGDSQSAIQYAFLAMNERQDFPDPYLKLHDAYMDIEKWEKAIHWGEAGLKMKPVQTFMINDPSYYEWRVPLSLSFCYMQVDRIDEAYKLFQSVKKLTPDLDFIKNNEKWYTQAYEEKAFLERFIFLLMYFENNEPKKIKELIKIIPSSMSENDLVLKIKNKYGTPREWGENTVTFICGETLDAWAPPTLQTGIGGSEEATIHISQQLALRGYDVTVYNKCGDMEGEYNGVKFINWNKLNPLDNFNILIGWRSNIFRMCNFKAHQKYIWLHDVYQQGTCEDHNQYDAIIVLSEFHKSLLPACIPQDKIIVSANGITINAVPDVKRQHNRIIYASSYDRGLEHLLRRWNEVIAAVPEAELHIYYGWNNYEKLVRDGVCSSEFMVEMKQLMTQPGIYEHGRIGQDQLHEEFAKSRIWAYPCHFNEISCITAMKAQELGCIPVCTNHAALKETVKSGVIIEGNAADESVMSEFIHKLIETLKSDKEADEVDYDFSWSAVASQWHKEFKKRTWNPYDFESLESYKDVYSNMSEENVTLVDKNILTHRHKYALDKLVNNNCQSLLDIGTFDGSLPVYAARVGIESIGIDINDTFINAGKESINGDPCTLIGGITFEEFTTDKQFDCVSATEVIEHVIDVDKFLEKAHSLTKDGGIIIVSTPHRLGFYGVTDHNPHHIRHYTEETLTKDMSKYFEVKDIIVENELINCWGIKK